MGDKYSALTLFSPIYTFPSLKLSPSFCKNDAEKYLSEMLYYCRQLAGDNKVVFEHPINLYLHEINVPITGWLDVAIFDKDDDTKLIDWIENKTSYPKPKGFYKRITGDNKVGDRRWENMSVPINPSKYYESQTQNNNRLLYDGYLSWINRFACLVSKTCT